MVSLSRRFLSTSCYLLLGAYALVSPLSGQETLLEQDATLDSAPQKSAPKEISPIPDAPTSSSQNVEYAPIDLGTALGLAGAENPQLLLARQRVIEAVAIRQLAAAQILPSINVGSNLDAHNGPLQQSNGNILKTNRDALYFGLGANAIAAGSVNIPGISYNLNVGQAWFDYLRSRQELRSKQFESQAVNNEVLLKVCIAYTQLLRAIEFRAIVTQNRNEGAEVARLTRSYAESGQGRKADADRALVELRRRDAEVVQANAEVIAASARLCELLNLNPSTTLRPIEGAVVPEPIVPEPVPMADLIAIAMMQRPELAARRAEIRAALYTLSSARLLPFSPNMIVGFSSGGFGGGSNLVNAGFPSGNGIIQGPRFGNFNGRSDLDIVAYWTLSNVGIGNLAMVRAARSRMEQSNLRELETLNRVRAEVAEAYASVHARYDQIATLEESVKASQEAFKEDVVRIRGQEGLPIELIDSLRLLGRARTEYLDAIIAYNEAQFRLYVALGQPPADSLARPVDKDIAKPVQGAEETTEIPKETDEK